MVAQRDDRDLLKSRGTARLGRPRNLSLFDDVTGLMSLDGRSSIISGRTSPSFSLSFSLSLCVGRVPKRIAGHN